MAKFLMWVIAVGTFFLAFSAPATPMAAALGFMAGLMLEWVYRSESKEAISSKGAT